MRLTPKNDNPGVVKSVMIAYLVLVLHVVLLAGLGILILFFRGVVNYMVSLFLAGSVAILVSGYLFYRRMKAEGITIREMLRSPLLQSRSMEVSFLGGFASFKVGGSEVSPLLDTDRKDPPLLLEDSGMLRDRELKALVGMLEKDLISLDEYRKAKQEILKT